MKTKLDSLIFLEESNPKIYLKCWVFCLDIPSLKYKCILSDGTYFSGKGQRTVNLIDRCFACKCSKTPTYFFFSTMLTCTRRVECNITYCKWNIAWTQFLCNNSWLIMKTTGFEILLSWYWYTWNRCIRLKKSKMKYVAG